MAEQVVGVDGYPRGWVAVVLAEGAFERARTFRDFVAVLDDFSGAACIAVDIPIGGGPREADAAARAFVGPRRSSVFPTPPAEIVALDDYREALSRHPGLSRQTFALFRKIREVAEHATDSRVVEVHPEVSFRALKGAELESPKTTWDGFMERRRLLAEAGIALPDELGSGLPLVDVLDAAVAAWSARRYALGRAESLPSGASPGGRAVIWY